MKHIRHTQTARDSQRMGTWVPTSALTAVPDVDTTDQGCVVCTLQLPTKELDDLSRGNADINCVNATDMTRHFTANGPTAHPSTAARTVPNASDDGMRNLFRFMIGALPTALKCTRILEASCIANQIDVGVEAAARGPVFANPDAVAYRRHSSPCPAVVNLDPVNQKHGCAGDGAWHTPCASSDTLYTSDTIVCTCHSSCYSLSSNRVHWHNSTNTLSPAPYGRAVLQLSAFPNRAVRDIPMLNARAHNTIIMPIYTRHSSGDGNKFYRAVFEKTAATTEIQRFWLGEFPLNRRAQNPP